MAKQNKGRKLFATTATAALVASAIVPVASAAEVKDFDQVPAWAKDAVKYLVDNGSVQGDENGNFKPFGNLTRAQAAEILTKELKLEATGTEDYSDVAEGQWFYKAVVATSPEIFNGNEKGQFLPNANLTRQEAAKVLVEAYGLTGTASLSTFADAASVPGWSKSYLETSVATGVINGKNGKLAPTDYITNAEFATMVKRAIDAAVPAVTAVAADSTTTLVLSGTNLKGFKAEDFTVSNNTVKSFAASENGKTATITLNTQLVDGEEVTVTVGDKKFTFIYKLDVTTVAIKEATYDDDTKYQFLKITVDGKELTASDLIASGYDVKFEAYEDKKGTETADIFEDEKTGLLLDNLQDYATLTEGKDAYVTVTATKGSEVITSDLAKITIKNTDLATDSITDYVLTNTTTGVDQSSTVLLKGEEAVISAITVKAGSDEDDIELEDGLYTVKSSNPAVVAVDSDYNLTALTPGTSTITITYGKVTKTVNIKVENGVRDLKQVDVVNAAGSKVSSSALAVYGDTAVTSTVYLKPVDQFGDVFTGNDVNTLDLGVSSSSDSIATASIGTVTASGWYPVTLTPKAKGTAYLNITNDGFKPTQSTLKISVSENATVSQFKLELVGTTGYSKDATLNLSADTKVRYALNGYTSEGIKVGAVDLSDADITVTQNASVIKEPVLIGEETQNAFDIEADSKTGTATVTVTFNGKKYSQKITVVNEALSVKSVSFKSLVSPKYATTYTYKNALTTNESGNNPIVSGITFTSTPSQPVRIVPTTGEIYIDKNADGTQNEGEDTLALLYMQFIAVDGTVGTPVTDVEDGIEVGTGNDEGTLSYVVTNVDGTVVYASTSVKVDL